MLEIIKEPSDLLHQKAKDVLPEEFNIELSKKLSDMAITMYASGGVGLAGPQVGDLRKILVADIGYVEGATYGSSLIKMVNPEIIEFSDKFESLEGCLSIPNFEQIIKRYRHIKVSYQDEEGTQKLENFDGYSAIVIQHEIEHLFGKTLLSHAGKLSKSRYLKRIHSEKNR